MQGDPAAAGWTAFPVRGGFEQLVGPLWYKRFDDGWRYGLRAEERHANPNGLIHGGMLVTLVDHTLGAAVFHAIGKRPCATISLNCDFVAGTKPGAWIEASARITRQGRSLVFVRGELTAGATTVLTADGVWKVLGAN